MVYLLVNTPLTDLKVGRSIYLVSQYELVLLEFCDPGIDKARRIFVIGVESAREESRGCASPPIVIHNRP